MELDKIINEHYHLFNEAEQYIAKAILQNKKECEHFTIKQFSKLIHVSESALTRFSQKIGLQGYKEIKSMIRIERMVMDKSEYQNQKQIIDNYHKVIDYFENLNNDELFERIYQAKRILIFADGFTMSKVASECKRMLLPLQKKVYYIHGHDMIQSFASLVNNEDITFIFSYKGDTKTVETLAKHLKLQGNTVVSVTKLDTNRLAQICDFNLYAHTLETVINSQLSFESSTPFYLLIELLIIKYQMYCEHNCK